MVQAFIKAICVVLLTYKGYYINDTQFLYMNYLGTIPVAAFLSLSAPLKRLNKELPYDNFFSRINIFSIFG